MSPLATNINALVDLYVSNYPLDAFTNLRLNQILHLLTGLADANSSGSSNQANIIPMVSANFSNTTDCPIPALNGNKIRVFYDELNRFLEQDKGEWQDLVGGGFRILIPGFDSTQDNYHFYVFIQS